MKIRKLYPVLLVAFLALVTIAAAPMVQDADPVDGLIGEALGVLGLGALALIPAAVVNVLKAVGLVKDGQSKTWATMMGGAFLAIAYGFNLITPDLFTEYTPAILAGADWVMETAGVLLQIIVILTGAGWTHDKILRGLPWIGKVNS
jgi:hypothetical protein